MDANHGEKRETGLSVKGTFLFAGLLFLPCFWVLAWAVAPSVTFHDSGEFVLAAISAGISHPPGAPLWTLLAHGFLKLFSFADPAYGTNLFSAFWGAVTLALAGVLAANWAGRVFPPVPRWIMLSGGVLSALTLLRSAAFIEQATTTKNYTLNTALIVIFLLIGNLFMTNGPVSMRQSLARSFFLGLTYGMAVGSHTCLMVLGFPAGFLLCRAACQSTKKSACTSFVAAGGGLLAGLSVFAWIPWRAATHPLLNYGHVENAKIFWRFLNRQQLTPRALADVPAGFIHEWITSYDFGGQLGWFGVCLAVAGLIWLAQRRPFLLLCIAAILVPYAAGMLLGHLHQATIGILYIRQYGVSTFHLPMYLILSLAAGLGLAGILHRLQRSTPAGARAVALGSLVLSAGVAWGAVGNQSLRHYDAPASLVRAVLAPIPKGAILLPHGDNLTHLLAYEAYGPRQDRERWVAYDIPPITAAIQQAADSGGEWSAALRLRHLTQVLCNPVTQPLTLPQLSEARLRESPVFTEYSPDYPLSARWLLPAGFLFEVKDSPTTDDEVRWAEAQWRREHPAAWKTPSPHADRMEREAWALLFVSRGAFFAARGFWPEADASYRCALEWYPADGNLWFCLADIKEKRGLIGDAEHAYRQALCYAPYQAGIRWNLALLLANEDAMAYRQAVAAGVPPEIRDRARLPRRTGIRELLEEEHRLSPNKKEFRRALQEFRVSENPEP